MPMILTALVITIFILVSINKDMKQRQARYGRGPWGWPFVAWVAIGLVSGVLSGLVYWWAGKRQDRMDDDSNGTVMPSRVAKER